jgi:HEAT repeat protein
VNIAFVATAAVALALATAADPVPDAVLDRPPLGPAEIDVAGLSSRLSSRHAPTRASAARDLGRAGRAAAPAVPRLLELLSDDHEFAWEGLDENGHALGTSSPGDEAAIALGSIGEPAIQGLIEKLEDREDTVRWRAVYALGRTGDARAVEPLISALQDRNADVRIAAARALPHGDSRTVEPFLAALSDRNATVRDQAAQALVAAADVRAVEPLIERLRRDEDVDVTVHSIEALATIGDPRAVPELLSVLHDGARGSLVRATAARALGKLGAASAFEGLVSAANDSDGSVRVAATLALGDLGDPRALPTLLAGLRGRNLGEQIAAARALGVLEDAQAVEALIVAIETDSPAAVGSTERAILREDAARSLGAIGDSRAIEPLLAALADRYATVRRAAAHALGRIADPTAVETLRAALEDRDS